MKRPIKKIYILLFALTIIFASLVPSLAADTIEMPYTIYESRDSEYIGCGILHENIQRFTSKGWWNINLIRVDLANEWAEVNGLFSSSGLSNRDSISKMVTDSRAIAGVNGDFFNYTPIASSLGPLIDKGRILSLPVAPSETSPALPTFYINDDNEGGIDFFDRTVVLRSRDSGREQEIHLINKSADHKAVILLDKHWGSQSIGNRFGDDVLEMLIIDDIIWEMRLGQEPISIPDNGYVIVADGSFKDKLLSDFMPGDTVEVDISSKPDFDNIKFAIGGGSVILKDGRISNSSIDIKGDHPRTGIGVSRDGKQLLIATIDGRGTSYKGVSQEVFGAILRDLGAYNGVNLDGGGSTTMAIRPLGDQAAKVINKPSDGGERKVVNGIGVSSKAPNGSLSYLKISTDETKMFPNTIRKFIVKGYDEHHNPIEINQDGVKYSIDGVDGEIKDNIFRAKSSGNATITASYKGIDASLDIRVLDEIQSIVVPISSFHLDCNSQKSIGTIYGKDRNGYSAKVYTEDIGWTVTGDIGYVEGGIFYSGDKSATGGITINVNDKRNNILVSVGTSQSEGVLIEGFENVENFRVMTYPDYVVGNMEENKDAFEGDYSIGLKYDFTQGEDTRAAYLLFAPDEEGLELEGKPNEVSLWIKGGNNGAWLRGIIRGGDGSKHTVEFTKSLNPTEWQYVKAAIPANISYPLTLERIYLVETDGAKKYEGEILFDNLMAFYPPSFDDVELPKPSLLVDAGYGKGKLERDGYSVMITRPSGTQNEAQIIADRVDKANCHDLNVIVGQSWDELNKAIKSDKIINIGSPYTSHEYKNLKLIDMSSAKGGIRPTNPQQWLWLKNDIANIREDHIMLFLNTPIFGNGGFADKLEADLLHETLVDLYEKGKNIWVIYNGNATKRDLKDGIRYVELNEKNDYSIEFVVNGKDIIYKFTD